MNTPDDHQKPESVAEALRFLNRFAESTSVDATLFLPGLYRVRAVNRGQGGWMRLVFYGYPARDAESLARQLLLPDPELVFPLDEGLAYEGVPANEGFEFGMVR